MAQEEINEMSAGPSTSDIEDVPARSKPDSGRRHWTDWLWPSVCAAALMVLAFAQAHQAVSGVRWPYDFDALRDVGTAQSILDGEYPGDYLYAGETLWYNPLVGAMVALGAKLSGAPPHRVDVALGPFVNLLVPVSFFVLAGVLTGPWSALAALALFLFGVAPPRATWLTATYSPWLFAPNFSLALFFITLVLYQSVRRPSWLSGIVVGIGWGVAFLGHTAPAIMLGGIFVILALVEAVAGRSRGKSWRTRLWPPANMFLMSSVVAFIVSLPYTYSIFWNYRFRVRNFAPASYVDYHLTLENLPNLAGESISPFAAVAILGLIAVAFSRTAHRSRRITMAWFALATVFLAYSYAWQWLMATGAHQPLPQVVPGYHFLPYLDAIKALLFGIGVWQLSGLFARLVRRLGSARLRTLLTAKQCVVRDVFVLGCTGISCAVLYPTYVTWREFTVTADRAVYTASSESFEPVYAWIRANTRPCDVFLCTSVDDAVMIVGSAGRKVVAPMEYFANIYVDYAPRSSARTEMLDAIRRGDVRVFRRYAESYRVRFLLTRGNDWGSVIKERGTFLIERFCRGDLRVYEVR